MRIEQLASIAYDGFCRQLCQTEAVTNHYHDTFESMLDNDIRKAWIAAIGAVVNAMKHETE